LSNLELRKSGKEPWTPTLENVVFLRRSMHEEQRNLNGYRDLFNIQGSAISRDETTDKH